MFARRYAASGAPLGAEFPVNTFTTGHQGSPVVASAVSGRFVVAWQGDAQDGGGSGIFARRYDVTGAPEGAEFQVNTFTGADQLQPSLAMDPAGNSVVVWTSQNQDGSAGGVFAQRFGVSGARLGEEFQVNAYTPGDQTASAATSDASGNFTVVWVSDGQDGSATGIFGQRFDAAGAPRGSEFRVNTFTSWDQAVPTLSADAAGDFVVSWSRVHYAGGPPGPVMHYSLWAQRYAASGEPRGAEFQIDSAGAMAYPAAAALVVEPAGDFLVAWNSQHEPWPGNRGGIFARRHHETGARRGAEFQVNTYSTDSQGSPSIAVDAAGNAIVVWESRQSPFFPPGQDGDKSGVFAQRIGGIVPAALEVDTTASGGADGNRVLEPGETVDVRPSWRNLNGAAQTLDATVLGFAGPPATGVSHRVLDGAGAYGAVPDGVTTSCTDCYGIAVGFSGTRPDTHWDATLTERLTPDALGQTMPWSVHVGESFTDVPKTSPFYRFVETLLHASVTAGCSAGAYCPAAPTTREQMAAFVLLAKEGASYAAEPCAVPNTFADVPEYHPFCDVIEELARRGVVGGCGNGRFCPALAVSREQMAVFVLRTLDPSLSPPACGTPMFADVPASSPFCPWVEELARRGVVAGCGGGNYCPLLPVAREQMAVFLTVTFGLTLYGA